MCHDENQNAQKEYEQRRDRAKESRGKASIPTRKRTSKEPESVRSGFGARFGILNPAGLLVLSG
jgi:hypothetical protein